MKKNEISGYSLIALFWNILQLLIFMTLILYCIKKDTWHTANNNLQHYFVQGLSHWGYIWHLDSQSSRESQETAITLQGDDLRAGKGVGRSQKTTTEGEMVNIWALKQLASQWLPPVLSFSLQNGHNKKKLCQQNQPFCQILAA